MLFGPAQLYIIADVDLVKEITVKHFDKFADRIVSTIAWALTIVQPGCNYNYATWSSCWEFIAENCSCTLQIPIE